ncbi:uncharacterized protein M6B38_125580 [Iris pallida]|uniref:RING-type domain-containing protein n=1 Tax=Iris pallida TaxID=29817 RepID=A0AAX6GPC0_IRIPA|nr:uncharacterized protein M6B38_125580 [Iris pallida]
MGYDAMANDTSSAPAVAKKKRQVNRSARLKQCKQDPGEQWLSQGKNKSMSTATSLALPQRIAEGRSTDREPSERDGLRLGECSALESLTHHHLGRNPPSNNSTCSSGSSIGSCSRSVSDAEEERREKGGGGLDDWEAVADALSADEEVDQDRRTKSSGISSVTVNDSGTRAMRTSESTKREPVRTIPRAWRPDDAFRPQSLPNVSKQQSFLGNMDRRCAVHRHDHRVILLAPPSSCPICYEDLDVTDSSFQPCSCGFHLCLFCHKRILEADGRCPGCRKQYSTSEEMRVSVGGPAPPLPYRLSQSCSLSSRS